jgi:hypothetical protein
MTGLDEVANVTDIDSYRKAASALAASDQPAPEGDAADDAGDEDAAPAEGDADKPKDADAKADEDSQDAEEGSDEEAQADAGTTRPPQYRWRPKSEVDALAMDIIKRAEKSGKEMTLNEALAQAGAILAPDKGSDADAGDTGGAEALPDTLKDAEALLVDLRAQRKQAFAKDLDFERAAELDERIEALRDHLGTLKNAEAAARQDQEAAWEQTLAEAKTKAVALYPDAAQPTSALVKRMVEIDAALKETGNDLFYSPEKPLKLAQMAANELGIAPRAGGAKPASSQPVKSRPVQPQPASATARTTQGSPSGQSVVDLDKVVDEDSWREATRKLQAA